MAWSVAITIVDLAERQASVTATRTDDADSDDVRTYCLSSVFVDTDNLPRTRQLIVDGIWSLHEAALVRESEIAGMIGGWENALAGDLDGLEGG